MQEKKIEELRNRLGWDKSIIHVEEDHYYIMSETILGNTVLLQEKNGIVVWAYDVEGESSGELIKIIDEIFSEKVIFPYVEKSDEINLLQNLGYLQMEYDDPDVENEIKKNPSFVRTERGGV